jgi:hypothetical protein
MRGAISTLPYAFIAWCSVKAQGQLYLYLYKKMYELTTDTLQQLLAYDENLDGNILEYLMGRKRP